MEHSEDTLTTELKKITARRRKVESDLRKVTREECDAKRALNEARCEANPLICIAQELIAKAAHVRKIDVSDDVAACRNWIMMHVVPTESEVEGLGQCRRWEIAIPRVLYRHRLGIASLVVVQTGRRHILETVEHAAFGRSHSEGLLNAMYGRAVLQTLDLDTEPLGYQIEEAKQILGIARVMAG
jgi:hypothetical protein